METCSPRMPELIYSTPFVMAQNCEMHCCQWYEVKRIKSNFRKKEELGKKVWDTTLLPKVVLIPSIKPISSSISLRC